VPSRDALHSAAHRELSVRRANDTLTARTAALSARDRQLKEEIDSIPPPPVLKKKLLDASASVLWSGTTETKAFVRGALRRSTSSARRTRRGELRHPNHLQSRRGGGAESDVFKIKHENVIRRWLTNARCPQGRGGQSTRRKLQGSWSMTRSVDNRISSSTMSER
jgi:hypothetical protein